MQSYVSGPTDTPLLSETIGDRFARTVAEHGEREALVACHQDLRLTYSELDAKVDEVARALLALGLEKGDRVGIWSPNCAEWIYVQFATGKLGIVLVNINPAYRTSELQYALTQSGCKALVAARSFKTSDYVSMIEEVRPALTDLEHVVLIGGAEWADFLDKGSAVDAAKVAEAQANTDQHDPINIQYTSGTTGFPKGATLTHHNILNNGYFVAELCNQTEEDRVCIPVPFYHCFGMVMGNLGCITHGSTMVIPEAAFEPGAVLKAVSEEQCTSLFGVPTMFIGELDHPEFESFDFSSLRTGIMAGSPCPIEVMRRVIDRMNMTEVTICYGMTETSPVSTQTRADDDVEHRVSTVGTVHPHVEVKVVDPATGETVERGEPGELCTRGYSVMKGYWNDPERTADAIDSDGFMHTGDLATMDADGYLKIVGRSKDMVIRGGENVYPREIEEFLYGHPDVADVQVVGVPDQRFGEELCAFVITREGASIDLDIVREYCKGKIAHYKVPRYVQVVDEFPMTVTGKVQKFKLRDDAIAELGLAPAAETA